MLWILLIIAAFALGKRASLAVGDVQSFRVGPYTVAIANIDTSLPNAMFPADVPNGYAWAVYRSEDYDAGKSVGVELAYGDGLATESEARKAAARWIASQQVPAPVGVIAEPATERAGVRMSKNCKSLTVTDLDQWIDYALPIIREYDVEEPQADQVMALTLGAAFRNCDVLQQKPKIRGASWQATSARVQRLIEKIRAGKLVSVEEPEEAVAARIVGMSAPRIPGAAAYVVDGWQGAPYAVVIVPEGEQWRYRVWAGPRGANRDAFATALVPTNTAAAAAANEEAMRPK